jgi:hypothetical protein
MSAAGRLVGFGVVLIALVAFGYLVGTLVGAG